jgi:hypothetical protein
MIFYMVKFRIWIRNLKLRIRIRNLKLRIWILQKVLDHCGSGTTTLIRWTNYDRYILKLKLKKNVFTTCDF